VWCSVVNLLYRLFCRHWLELLIKKVLPTTLCYSCGLHLPMLSLYVTVDKLTVSSVLMFPCVSGMSSVIVVRTVLCRRELFTYWHKKLTEKLHNTNCTHCVMFYQTFSLFHIFTLTTLSTDNYGQKVLCEFILNELFY